MKVECNKEDVARMLKREIEDLSRSIPAEMQIRELVQNSVEALSRRIQSGIKVESIPKKSIKIMPFKPHDFDVRKFCIVNYGEDLTRKIMREHLMNYRNSGNLAVGFDQNKGVGWKVCCLPKNTLGVRFYFWEEGQCLYFTVRLNDVGEYETENVFDEETDEYHEFFEATKEEADNLFGTTKMGTAVALLGNTPEEETYHSLHHSCSTHGQNDKSYGRSILKFINQRYWDNPLPEPYKLGVFQEYKTMRNQILYSEGTSIKVKDKFDTAMFSFPISFEGIEADVEIFAKDKGITANSFERIGFFGIEYKGEIYHNIKSGVRSRKSTNRKCGLTIKPDNFCIFVRIKKADELRVNTERTGLNHHNGPLDLEALYKAISEMRPPDLDAFLESLVEQDVTDLNKQAVRHLKNLNLSIPSPKKAPGVGSSGVNPKNSNNLGQKTPTKKIAKKKKSSISTKLTNSEAPRINVIPVEDDDKVDTVHFLPNSYELNVHENCHHIHSKIVQWRQLGYSEAVILDLTKKVTQRIAFNALEWMHSTCIKEKLAKKTPTDIEKTLEENIKYGCDLRQGQSHEIVKKYKTIIG